MSHSKVVQVVTLAVEKEGLKWKQLSDRVGQIKTQVDMLDLRETAFMAGLDLGTAFKAEFHSKEYDEFQSYLAGLLAGAQVEFEQLGEALQKIATKYDRADAIAAIDIGDVFGDPR